MEARLLKHGVLLLCGVHQHVLIKLFSVERGMTTTWRAHRRLHGQFGDINWLLEAFLLQSNDSSNNKEECDYCDENKHPGNTFPRFELSCFQQFYLFINFSCDFGDWNKLTAHKFFHLVAICSREFLGSWRKLHALALFGLWFLKVVSEIE